MLNIFLDVNAILTTNVLVGWLLFLACLCAVFSEKFDDGIVGRHILTFSAICSFAYACNGEPRALLTAYILLISLSMWLTLRKVIRLAYTKEN